MAEISTSFIDIQNINISERVLGEGEAVLMLHGWGANIELLSPLGERLANRGYCVYMLDLPGFGESGEPPTSWSSIDYANFVIAYMDHHDLTDIYLFGHSFGGRLGLILGAEHGNRIQKMVLADSAGVLSKAPLSVRLRLSAYKTIRDSLYTIGASKLADNLRSWYGNRYGSTDYQNVSGIMRETFVKVVNMDLLSYAASVQPSTLLLWGAKDNDTPLWQGQLLEQTIPEAGLVVYEDAGHYSYLEKLNEATQVISFFFQQE